ncbi:LAGLIDADG family homing endonuclease [Parageobacillus galactosidasius]|uniref:DOD-type homing endonuclease domain-containing protein n=1 Tax=Parageobacillus galactosidasius TaxID=883812 RepID=A0A226QQB9_9BACL|nr:LAGLIDADG family homing endonuclease [Parageobacillus galactosidasius]OXB94693.1 hypothetical protein B9L23_07445 [Parageobacillus galactosidasius]
MKSKGIPYNQLTENHKEQIIELYYKNVSFEDIHKMLGVSMRSVSRVLKEAGINTRLKNRYTLNHDYFEEIDTEEKAYWLGFLYADGFVGNEKYNNIVLSLKQSDIGHIEKFAKAISYTGDIRITKRGNSFKPTSKQAIINFSSKKMASDLRHWGLFPGKSTKMKKFPSINKELIRHFIRGYFDGDGSISCYRNITRKKGKTYIYQKPNISIIGTESFIKEMATYLPHETRFIESHSENMIYLLATGKKPVYTIMSYLYNNATIYLERKFNKWLEIAPLCRNA